MTHGSSLARLLSAAALLFAFAARAEGWATLVDGVLIDPTSSRALVMTKKPDVELVDLSTGKAKWSNKDAAVPLAVVGNSVIALRHTNAPGELWISELDLATGKERTTYAAVPVPAGVTPELGITRGHAFGIYAARQLGTKVTIAWIDERWPAGDVHLTPEQARAAQRQLSGSFRVDVSKQAASDWDFQAVDVARRPTLAPRPPRDTGGITADGVSFELHEETLDSGKVKVTLQRTAGMQPQPLITLAESAEPDSALVAADASSVALITPEAKGPGVTLTVTSASSGKELGRVKLAAFPLGYVATSTAITWFDTTKPPHVRTQDLKTGKTISAVQVLDVVPKQKPIP